MTDKTLEAVVEAIKALNVIGNEYCEEIAQAAIAAHDNELKKHIKVLVDCLESYRYASSVKHPSIHANADKALASLPEELRGL